MKNGFFKLGFIAVAVLSLSCSKNTPGHPDGPAVKEKKTFQGATYKTLQGAKITQTKSGLSGKGKLVFLAPLMDEDNNYQLEFTLEKGGSLSAITNANASLGQGVNIVFSRGDDDRLNIALKVGAEDYDITEDFDVTSAAENVSVHIDVHAHGHVIFELNEGEEMEFAFDSEVLGQAWGLDLNNVTLTNAKIGPAEHGH